jgi:hypothetical protein
LVIVWAAEGAVITVKADGSGDYPTIQSAIDDANDGDEIVCGDGIYTGDGNRDIDYLGKAITVRSENGPENCIIDCMDSGCGFYFHSGEDFNSILDGLTITNGWTSVDGGITCEQSSPTIKNCIITRNKGRRGGGFFAGNNSNAILNNCYITDNEGGLRGGGVRVESSSITIVNSVIAGNSVRGFYRWGGGIYFSQSNSTITNCTIADNHASNWGGGIYCTDSNLSITSCILWSNDAPLGSEMYLCKDTYLSVGYSDVEGGEGSVYVEPNSVLQWGFGNIDMEPNFVTASYWGDVNDVNIVVEPNDVNAVWVDGDYHLLDGSPCINAGDPNYAAGPGETDLDGNKRVVDGRIDMGAYEYFNTAPVACIVGGDRSVEADSNCEGRVVLDGSCSSDADSTAGTNDDINDFDWYVVDSCDPNYEDYLGSGEVIECNLPLGENIIVLEVTDKAGAFDSNEVTITVEDVTPPEFSLAVEPNELWPPNHKMVLITVEWEVSDNCDDWPEVRLVSITSSEEDDGKGDGATSDDIVIGEDGSIYLRAERAGYLEGRVYTITYEAVDDSGNATVRSAEVVVPDGHR